MNRKEYVAGFLFNWQLSQVALVEKKRPNWQAGKFNAIGGKVELGESYFDAMRREFREETGHDSPDWTYFCELSDSSHTWAVHFFVSVAGRGDRITELVKTTTDESIFVRPSQVHEENRIDNLRWLMPMAIASVKTRQLNRVETQLPNDYR